MVATPHKLGSISLGGDQTTRTRRNVVLEWSDDDEAPTVPSPSTKEPPRNKRAPRSDDAPELATEEVPEQ